MSSQIEAERKEYYQKLKTTKCGDVNVTRWLAWFLKCLECASDGAEQGLSGVLNKSRLWQRINRNPVNVRQRLVINRLLNGFDGFLMTSKYGKLAKCSPDTALLTFRNY